MSLTCIIKLRDIPRLLEQTSLFFLESLMALSLNFCINSPPWPEALVKVKQVKLVR